ncbi:hypothetical protein ACHWQZ_G003315 [Mnemiopsis leidyi]
MVVSNHYKIWDYLSLVTILTVSFSGSLTAAVRYGFLTDSFTEKSVHGKYIGMIGGSMFYGFLLCYLTRTTELLLKHFTPKTLLQVDQCLNLLYPVGCILSYHFPLDKSWLVTLNIALRVYNGFLGYPRCLLLIDMTKTQFGRDFDSVNSLIQMGVYAGHGLGAAAGSGLYDKFGYNAPFYLVTAMLLLPITMTTVFVPNCPSHTVAGAEKEERILIGEEETSSSENEEIAAINPNLSTPEYGTCSEQKETKSRKQPRLTPAIAVPLIGTMLVNIVYGYLQITITPYLNRKFGISIGDGGLVLATVSVGMVLGSLTSAYLMRGHKISAYTQMIMGSVFVGAGILLMFPIKYLRFLYDNSPYIAFPAAFLAGFGDPLITIASLTAMKNVQLKITGGITPDQELLIGGTWLIGFLALCFAGQEIAGFMTEYLEYWVGALILFGMSCVSFIISGALYVNFKT